MHKRHQVFLAAGAVIAIGIGSLTWQSLSRTSLLPSAVQKRIHGFTPYFYTKKVPAGYTVDTAHTSFQSNVLLVPLKSQNGPGIVLTEQALPSKLSAEDIQKNGEAVEGAAGKATINDVEGRLVGTMISPDNKTMILLNAPGSADKDDLAELLKGLKPLKN